MNAKAGYRRPPDQTKPGGPKRRVDVYLEPDQKRELVASARARGWTLSKECGFLIAEGLRALAERQRSSDPLEDRAIEIMRSAGVNRRTAIKLARQERARGL